MFYVFIFVFCGRGVVNIVIVFSVLEGPLQWVKVVVLV